MLNVAFSLLIWFSSYDYFSNNTVMLFEGKKAFNQKRVAKPLTNLFFHSRPHVNQSRFFCIYCSAILLLEHESHVIQTLILKSYEKSSFPFNESQQGITVITMLITQQGPSPAHIFPQAQVSFNKMEHYLTTSFFDNNF